MNKRVYAAARQYMRYIAKCILMLGIAACSGGDGTATNASGANLSITDANSGTAIRSGASVFTLSRIAIAGMDLSDASVAFVLSQNSTLPLIPDQASPDQFWLPLVLEPTAGKLIISNPGKAPFSMPLTLLPFATSGVSGEATQVFFRSSLSTIDAAIDGLRMAARPLPEMSRALQAVRNFTQQQLTWINSTMQNGSAGISRRQNGMPVAMTKEDLKALDQMVLYSGVLAANGGTLPQVTHSAPLKQFMDTIISSAHAQTAPCLATAIDIARCLASVQTIDKSAFANSAKAIGEALGLTADNAKTVADVGSGAFRVGADDQAVALMMIGLYGAHYGNALAMIQALQTANFSTANQVLMEAALRSLSIGIINEFKLSGLDLAEGDATITQILETSAAIDSTAVENIVLQIIQISLARANSVDLCPEDFIAVPVANDDYIACVSP